MFSSLKAKISGYKTYIVAITAILSAIVAWSGNQISLWNALQTILAALATVTMRAAVSKAITPTAPTSTQPIINPPGQPLDGGRSAGSTTSPATQVSGVNVTSNPNPIGTDRIN